MMTGKTLKKLQILSESAKYDVSGDSTGKKNTKGGSAKTTGVCRSFTDNGRCMSLLKILYSNACIYDCAYCVNRRSNDLRRTSFSPKELAELTIEFHRRKHIEGLFLSSAVVRNPDFTMERMINVLMLLRREHRFNGYIHMKTIPGASPELVRQAGLLADRLSVNIEIPSEANLQRLAPEKDYKSVYAPMRIIHEEKCRYLEERMRFRSSPRFAPAGQSTQVIIGASDERDRDILLLSSLLYAGPQLQRVYYSGFVPVNGHDSRLPSLTCAPLLREHRLYQADWLMRRYYFSAEEILDPLCPDLEMDIDPKLAWALRHPHLFPLDVNRAEFREILRVPGIGEVSARRIMVARRQRRLGTEQLAKLGVVMKRAAFFLTPQSMTQSVKTIQETGPAYVREALSDIPKAKRSYQLPLFSCIPQHGEAFPASPASAL